MCYTTLSKKDFTDAWVSWHEQSHLSRKPSHKYSFIFLIHILRQMLIYILCYVCYGVSLQRKLVSIVDRPETLVCFVQNTFVITRQLGLPYLWLHTFRIILRTQIWSGKSICFPLCIFGFFNFISGSRVYKLISRKMISKVSKMHQRIGRAALSFFGKNNVSLSVLFDTLYVWKSKDWTATDENRK